MASIAKSASMIRPRLQSALNLNLRRSLTLVQQTPAKPNTDLRITFFVNKFNSLSQRVFLELAKRNHAIKVFEVGKDNEMDNESIQQQSDMIICPFLTKRVPERVWKCKNPPALIVHPGIEGDRGMFAIDWALRKDLDEWGVTVLQADQEMDMGDIWSTNNFPIDRVNVNRLTKSSIYQNEVTEKAVEGVLKAVDNFKNNRPPRPLDYNQPGVKGYLHEKMVAKDRTVNWNHTSDDIANLVRMSDTQPGAIAEINIRGKGDELITEKFRVFGAHFEKGDMSFPRNNPGEVVGHRDGAILVKTGDGLVWLSHLKKNKLKLPSTLWLGDKLSEYPSLPAASFEIPHGTYPSTFQEIWTTVSPEGIAYVHFNFYNGAMGTQQCQRLVKAINNLQNDSRVNLVVFMGGHNYFSNGIHLNVIENCADPAQESWENINAINDVVKEFFTMPKYTISAVQGNAGAGGCMMALASDQVWAKKGAVMSPSYKSMNLFGSEYHTYFLQHRVGKAKADELLNKSDPLYSSDALEMGMFDKVMGDGVADFKRLAEEEAKRVVMEKPVKDVKTPEYFAELETYRDNELKQMAIDFQSEAYEKSRKAFVLH